jgi:hypothetical protein
LVLSNTVLSNILLSNISMSYIEPYNRVLVMSDRVWY